MLMVAQWNSPVLHHIERDLSAQDPGYVSRMRRAQAGMRPSPAVPVLAALIYITAPVTMLLFGWPGAVLTVAVGLTLIVVAVLRRRAAGPMRPAARERPR